MLSGLIRKTGESLDTFILTELREIRSSAEQRHNELRSQIEGRDSELRSQIASIREGVNNLSQAVAKSSDGVEATKEEIRSVKGEVTKLKVELDSLRDKYSLDQTKDQSSWDGPIKTGKVIGWFSAVLAGLAYLYTLAKSAGIVL